MSLELVREYFHPTLFPSWLCLYLQFLPLSLVIQLIDDLSLLSGSQEELQILLDRCVKVLNWAGMSFRAPKSRCMVIENGKCVKEALFFVNNSNSAPELIPSIHVSPFLGISWKSYI